MIVGTFDYLSGSIIYIMGAEGGGPDSIPDKSNLLISFSKSGLGFLDIGTNFLI